MTAARLSWDAIARRIRVPLGFVMAAGYLWLAQPAWRSLALGAVLVAAGLALRAAASGHVRKDSVLTITGPYAYTRHPLYLGSVILAAGFAVAARSLGIALAMALMFFLIYLPVMRNEEAWLRSNFAGYEEYARRVPRFFPALRPRGGAGGAFSWELYRRHREYQALVGAAGMLAALVVKMLWEK
jgi:protein-S-isoprenylcysteine O-methyltransferase Ste14